MNHFEAYQSCSLFGALRYFANIQDAVCLINGPSGCTFYARNAIVKLNGYFDKVEKVAIPKIFTAGFKEEDVIFGNEDKLQKAIDEIIEKHHPKIVFLLNCCVSEIIGTDIEQIAQDITDRTNVLVIPVHSAGFKGDHRHGMHLAASILTKYFFQKKTKVIPKRVNILGDFDFFNRSTQDLVNRLNKIGVTDILQVPGHASIEELKDVPNASLNIVTCQNASQYLATLLYEKFKTPFLGKGFDLYGLDSCYELYAALYDFFGKDLIPLKKELSEYKEKILPYRKKFKGKTAAIVAGTKRALGYAKILKDLGVKIVILFSESNEDQLDKKEFLQYSSNVLVNEYLDDVAQRIEKLNPDVIFSTLPEVVAPNKYIARMIDDFCGFEGVLKMAEYLDSYFIRKQQNNNVVWIRN